VKVCTACWQPVGDVVDSIISQNRSVVLHSRAWRWEPDTSDNGNTSCGTRRPTHRRPRRTCTLGEGTRCWTTTTLIRRRGRVSAVLRRHDAAPQSDAGHLLPSAAVGYFEGVDSERGIAWRAADSLAIRSFLRIAEAVPDHSTISRTRRPIDLETHRAVFTWVRQRPVEAGCSRGKTVAIDATTLEANAAMRSIVRRDTGESYQAFLTRLAEASGIKTPTREALARLDRKRKKKTSNNDWTSPADPDAKVAR
jgi:transposase